MAGRMQFMTHSDNGEASAKKSSHEHRDRDSLPKNTAPESHVNRLGHNALPESDTTNEVNAARAGTNDTPSSTAYGNKKAITPAQIAEKELALKAIKRTIQDAKQSGATQDEIAQQVLDGMGIIFGPNPFVKDGKGMRGWGG
jgi:coenzyme F420-reducing hydrogenase alpha subunit